MKPFKHSLGGALALATTILISVRCYAVGADTSGSGDFVLTPGVAADMSRAADAVFNPAQFPTGPDVQKLAEALDHHVDPNDPALSEVVEKIRTGTQDLIDKNDSSDLSPDETVSRALKLRVVTHVLAPYLRDENQAKDASEKFHFYYGLLDPQHQAFMTGMVMALTHGTRSPVPVPAGASGGREKKIALKLSGGAAVENQKLFDAAVLGDLEGVRDAVQKGADVNAIKDAQGRTALTAALRLRKPDWDMAALLLDHGADVNAADDLGRTPLMYLVSRGGKGRYNPPTALVDAFIAHGANVFAKDKKDLIALDFAEDAGLRKAVGRILGAMESGLQQLPPADKKYFANLLLMDSVRWDDLNGFNFAVRNGADIDAKDSADRTVLILAVRAHRVRMVNRLLRNGANEHARDNDGFTALWYAEMNHDDTLVKILDRGRGRGGGL